MNSIAQAPVAGLLGHRLVGTGPMRVVIMNDWLSDTSAWDDAAKYLSGASFTFAFADLRGYGRSRGRAGAFTVKEAAADVLRLADTLGWSEFSVVGHSMSALVALHLAQHFPGRIQRAVVVTPAPPAGLGADEAMISASRALAQADDSARRVVLEQRFGSRLSPTWMMYKLSRWRECADPVAVAGYVPMFARDGLPEPTVPITIPVLAITGEQDAPPMRSEAVQQSLGSLCSNLVVTPLADSGHYPMQEMPPLTVSLIERFLSD